MTAEKLDFIFPFIVFFYGTIMLLVLENSFFIKLGHERMATMYANMTRHRPLAWVCFFLGGLWSLQNVWYSNL